MGGAFCHTGRFHPCIHPIHAIIAFYRLVGVRVHLRNIPGTGPGAGHAADAFFLVNIDYAIVSLDHCIGGTDGDTERVVAMVAGTERKFGFRYPFHRFKRFMAYFTEKRADGQLFVGLAVDLTAMTANTTPGV